MKSLVKVGGVAVLFALLVSSALVWLLVVNAPAQQEPDSSQMELVLEKVRVTVKRGVQYELLKGMVGECPPFDSTHGEPWEFVINQWQRKQLEGIGAKVRVIDESKPDEEAQQVEYRLEREIDLKADGVENIIFGPKKDKSSALSEIILGLADEGKGVTKVSVYDFNFNLIGEMRLRDVTFSKDLKYIGGKEYTKASQEASARSVYKFQLFDYTGKKLWEFKERELYEVNCTYSISNKGTVIELDHGSGVATFIDQQRNETNKIKVCSSSGTPGEGIGGGIFSYDGEYALIVADQFCGDTLLGGKVRALFFSWGGEELWRFTIEDNTGGEAGISKFGDYVIVSSSVWPASDYPPDRIGTYLLSNKGELIKKYDNVFGSPICFSSNEKYALFDSYGTLFLIDLPSGEVLFKYDRWGGLFQHACLDIAEDAKLFGSATANAVALVGFDGTKIWSHPLSSEGGGFSLRLSDDGKEIIIAIGPKMMIYQQVE
ncbi:MAG: hypothetical protein WBF13_05870 [Candidatus Zixiibacteriota bacterium]